MNLAARLADVAERHEVLVTAAVQSEAAEVAGVEFVPRGRRALKGIAEEVDVFAAVAQNAEGGEERRVDPVWCGIEVRLSTAVARLVLDGEEQIFCCTTCLQRFVEAPERYRTTGAAKGR